MYENLSEIALYVTDQLKTKNGYAYHLKLKYINEVSHSFIKEQIGFQPQPPELKLHQLEEFLIGPFLIFMSSSPELPIAGQKSICGYVCHIPVDTSTVNKLPRTLDDRHIVSVKLKRKKHAGKQFSQNMRPTVVLEDLK